MEFDPYRTYTPDVPPRPRIQPREIEEFDSTDGCLSFILGVLGLIAILAIVGLIMAATQYKSCEKLYRAHANEPGWVNTELCFNYQGSTYMRRCMASGKSDRECRGY